MNGVKINKQKETVTSLVSVLFGNHSLNTPWYLFQ